MMNTFLLLGGILSAIALTAGGTFIFAKAHWAIKVLLSTLIVVLSVYAWSISVAVFGYAIDGAPADKAQIMAAIMDKHGGSIFLWIKERNGPRGYRIPYTDKMGEDLAKAEAQAKGNGGIMRYRSGKVKGDGENGEGNGKGGNGRQGKGKPNGNGGQFGGQAAGYGDAPMGGDNSPVDVTIDVIPSLPEKQ
jgi:hypothetical protein